MDGNNEQLFDREISFIAWLTWLMERHPDYADVSIEPLLRNPGKPNQQHSRADIIARRDGITLIIECKNRPLFSKEIDSVLLQFRRYSEHRPGTQLVLATPGKLAEIDANRIHAAGIELWDAEAIARIFARQIPSGPPHLATAFSSSGKQETKAEALIRELRECSPGRLEWPIYQKLVGRVLEHLFCPPLNVPLSESPDESGANRRDFILANFAESGFWNHMRLRYAADFIVVDAKNYVGKIKKRDVLQIANYLRPHGAGMFGVIFSRAGGDQSARITAREQWAHYQKLILVLDDNKCIAMLNAAGAGGAAAVLTREIQDFRLSM